MKSQRTSSRRLPSQRGQTFLVIVIFVAVFLLAVMGLATDYSQIWAHRQMAQGAADAACEAGAADVFVKGTDPTASTDFPALDFSWIGTTFDCSAKPNSVPCKYASLNGYSGSNVGVSFPGSLPGVPSIPPAFGTIANPYIQVRITDPVAMSFTKLVSATGTFNISAKGGCGLSPVKTPVPLVVLNRTASASLSVGGSSSITIIGGPQRSIQVDSNSPTAAAVGTVDLSLAGPSGTGADFAVSGGPAAQPSGVTLGTGNWIPGTFPLGDPYASVAAPASAPGTAGSATPVPLAMNGCPDPSGCVEFTGGNYTGCSAGIIVPGGNGCLVFPYSGGSRPKFSAGGTDWQAGHTYAVGTLIVPASNNSGGSMYQVLIAGTSAGGSGPKPWPQTPCTRQSNETCTAGTFVDGGVTWQNIGVVSLKPNTAIFDPGLYYLGANGLTIGDLSTVRMSTATGDGNGGMTLYFSTSDSVSVGSNAGKFAGCTTLSTPPNCIVSYKIDGTLSTAATDYVRSTALQCPSGSTIPSQVPALVDGNILLGPCSGAYASPDGNRGFLFFQNRATAAQASWGGGGQFLSSGFLYFHNGNGATCGTNTSCLTLQGNSGSGAYTLGSIVVDKLSLGGTPNINMILNPAATFSVLRPTLLQ